MKRQESEEYAKKARETLIANALTLSEKGFTEIEIAAILEVDRGKIARWLIDARGIVKDKGSNITEEERAQMVRLSRAGFSQKEIGDLLGYAQCAISQHLRSKRSEPD